MSTNKDNIALHITSTKEHRRDLDGVLQRLKTDCGEKNPGSLLHNNQRRSRERSLAITKIQEAIMWLGMDLKAINEEQPGSSPNPHPHSYNPEAPAIEPTADGLKL